MADHKKSMAEKIAAAAGTIVEQEEETKAVETAIDETSVEGTAADGEAADGTAADGTTAAAGNETEGSGALTENTDRGSKEAADEVPEAYASCQYVLNDEDFYKFNDFHCFETAHGKSSYMKRWAILPVFLAVALAVMAFSGADLIKLVIEAVVFVGALAYFYSRRRVTLRKSLEKAVTRANKEGRAIYNPSGTLYFTDDEIMDKGKLTSYSMKYADVYAVYRNVNNLYIYESPRMAILVLGHNFENEEEQMKVWDFLKGKIPADKWKN